MPKQDRAKMPMDEMYLVRRAGGALSTKDWSEPGRSVFERMHNRKPDSYKAWLHNDSSKIRSNYNKYCIMSSYTSQTSIGSINRRDNIIYIRVRQQT